MGSKGVSVGKVRAGYELDLEIVQRYMHDNIDGSIPLDKVVLKASQFTYGQSNPTYKIEVLDSNVRRKHYVLRKKPPGKLLPSAHAIEREYQVMRGLFNTDVPVPEVYCLCEDATLLGTPFYIMEYVEGRIFTDPSLPGMSRGERSAIMEQISLTMAKLHAVDYQAIGLQHWYRGHAYADRQLKTWSRQYRASLLPGSNTPEHVIGVIDYLQENIPEPNEYDTVLVHGDFRLGNLVFHPTQNRIIAILDWELCTLGHPFADLSYSCMAYFVHNNEQSLCDYNVVKLGIPQHKDFIMSYIQHAIRNGLVNITNLHDISTSSIDWEETYRFYMILSMFRITSILQGVLKRASNGNAASPYATRVGSEANTFANCSYKLCVSKEPIIFDLKEYSKLPVSLVAFETLLSNTFYDIKSRLLWFMDKFIILSIPLYDYQRRETGTWVIPPIIEALKKKAKEYNLWNLFLPDSIHGTGLSNLEYAPLCEIMGRVIHIAPEVFNCNAPDTGNMEVLVRYGSQKQKLEWLDPLLNGTIRSCFAMTEPFVASSDASNIECSIERDGDEYVLNGRKWWTSGAMDPRCEIAIVMGKTGDDSLPIHKRQSMILVPVKTKGFKIIRHLNVFGYDDSPHGHAEIILSDVRVPLENMILGAGRGFEIAQGRLGPGRIHHCMRAIGVAEHALDLMRKRSWTRVAFGSVLAKKETIIKDIAECCMEIEQARLLTLKAAHMMDILGNKEAKQYIAMIKVVAPNVALKVLDRAIQVHGGMGVSQDTPLAMLYAQLRTLRLADGPDEVHMYDTCTLLLT